MPAYMIRLATVSNKVVQMCVCLKLSPGLQELHAQSIGVHSIIVVLRAA